LKVTVAAVEVATVTFNGESKVIAGGCAGVVGEIGWAIVEDLEFVGADQC
jgi:hypothetical protein